MALQVGQGVEQATGQIAHASLALLGIAHQGQVDACPVILIVSLRSTGVHRVPFGLAITSDSIGFGQLYGNRYGASNGRVRGRRVTDRPLRPIPTLFWHSRGPR